MKHTGLVLVFLGFFVATQAQSAYRFGTLPTLNLSKKLKNDWKLDSKIQARQQFKRGVFGADATEKSNYLLTDIALVASRKVGLNNKIAGGYLMRITADEIIHRYIQQFTIAQQYNAFRMGHRFVADQTTAEGDPMTLRLRYRITAEFPLSGLFVDPNEFYIKLNHEYLNRFEGSAYDLEIRMVPFLGFMITDTNKLELGLDYRMSSFLDGNTRNDFWIGVNWYLKI